MGFKNENTWYKYAQEKREEEFHKNYDDAVSDVKDKLGKTFPNYIDGKYAEATSTFQVFPPFDTRIRIGNFQKSSKEDVRQAISAAKKAFAKWSSMEWQNRVRTLKAAAERVAEKKFFFAATISIESGKNRYEAVGDVDEAIDAIRFYCEEIEANNDFEAKMGKAFPNESAKSVMKPYGVWGVIGPFNFPLAIPVSMSAGAMITGNTVVFKPSSDTPLTMYRFAEVLKDVELPAGVFNFITGSGSEVGAEMVSNDDIAGIAFTGSRAVGYAIAKEFVSRRPRPVITEMGGKNPVIVSSKADLGKAVEGTLKSAFGYGGQKCSACSRVLVFENIKKEFLSMLVNRTKSIEVGDPTKKETFLGPLISKDAYEKYRKFVGVAKRDGKVVVGGRTLTAGEYSKGYFVEPTIVDELPENNRLMQEELFVPILCVQSVKNLDEAIAVANNTAYGLTAGIFSKDKNEIKYFFDNIEAGVVYANRSMGASTGAMVGVQPFGGWKASGSTGKGAGGKHYLQQFIREQSQTTVS